MPSKSKNRNSSKNRNGSKNRTCKVYRSCENVPCGEAMNRCKPSYCYTESSRNWTLCNMGRGNCRDESKCKLNKTKRKPRHTVLAKTLHEKMPYIWRFLRPQTRKHMIELANKPVNKINIPSHVFDTPINRMPKSQRKRYRTLRKKYKNI